MTIPLEIAFHGIPRSDWIEEDIRRRVSRLEACCPDILTCRVVVDRPHRHHQVGNRFRLRIDLMLTGSEIAVSQEASVYGSRKALADEAWVKQFETAAHRKDLRLVISEAFDVARRRVQSYVERRREVRVTRESRRRPAKGAARVA